MAHDAFISYSNQDKAIADAACAILENAGTRCWIAPRDVPPGSEWAAAIVGAIDQCRVLVLIFSAHANISNQIHREVERAVSKSIPIFPLRIEDVAPSRSMEYFLGAIHWLDALTPPLEKHLHRLSDAVRSYLDVEHTNGNEQSRPTPRQGAAIGSSLQASVPSGRRRALAVAICVLIVAGSGASFYYLKLRHQVTPPAAVAAPPPEQKVAPPLATVSPAVSPEQKSTSPALPSVPAQQPASEPALVTPAVVPSVLPPQPATPEPVRTIAFNETSVRQFAKKLNIPLPAQISVVAPSAKVSNQMAGLVGAWGGDRGWNGRGRTIVLIISDVDDNGTATGIYAQGPPTAYTPTQAPAKYAIFSTPVTEQGIKFSLGPLTYTFKPLPPNKMWGHLQGEIAQRHLDSTIEVQRIE